MSRRGAKYVNGPHKDWDVDAECPDLDLSLAALDVGDDATTSGSGTASFTRPLSSSAEQASCSIFYDEDEDQYDIY